MRIALLGPANVIHYRRWAYAIAEKGHEVHIISQHPDAEIAASALFASKTWLPFQSTLGYFLNIPKLLSTLAKIQPDLVNTHYASGYGLTSSSISKIPTILSVWGSDVYDFPYESRFKKKVLLWNLNRASSIASTSHAMAQQVNRLAPHLKFIHITPFGVDCKKFTPSLSKDDTNITIGIVKTLAPKYGIDLLIKSFAKAIERQSVKDFCKEKSISLLIVGDGPDRLKLKALSSQLDLDGCAVFTGHIHHDQVPLYLHKIDIFVVPSRLDSESFGVAAVEAAACSLPVVVSDAGGLPEVVADGTTGIVVKKNDECALAMALERLILNPQLRNEMGYEGRKRVIENYEWHHCIEKMLECYKLTLEEFQKKNK